jgi:hypothetical protein
MSQATKDELLRDLLTATNSLIISALNKLDDDASRDLAAVLESGLAEIRLTIIPSTGVALAGLHFADSSKPPLPLFALGRKNLSEKTN